MRRIRTLAVLSVLWAAVVSRAAAPVISKAPQAGEILTGKVVAVADGDTLTILVNKTQYRIRLHGIDCPESHQPFGTRAKQLTADLAFGKIARVEVLDRDRYGRLVGIVTVPRKDGQGEMILNHELLAAGLAWWYQKYAPDDQRLSALESKASKDKCGLWSDPGAIAPWEWRQRLKAEDAARGVEHVENTTSRFADNCPSATAEGQFWLNTASNVRHNSSCRYYKKTKQGRSCGPNEGRPCGNGGR